jgi:hypothetical protein
MRLSPSTKVAFFVVCASLAISALGYRALIHAFNVYVQKQPVPLRENLRTIPGQLGAWAQFGDDQQLSAEMVESLGTDIFLTRAYVRNQDPSQGMARVHLAYYTGMIDTVPHVPSRCYEAAGLPQVTQPRAIELPLSQREWETDEQVNLASGDHYRYTFRNRPITRDVTKVFLPVGDFEFMTTEFMIPDAPNRRMLAGYFFIANGRSTPYASGVKALAFSLRERYAYYCKVEMSMVFDANDESRWAEFASRSADLLDELLPEIMLRLPSWPEWESREVDRSTS